MLNVPNILTLLRIVAIPGFIILLTDRRFPEALALFVAAGITDAADGAIARFTNSKTTLGAHLDPLADKLLLVSSFITLAFMGQVPPWLLVIVITRDVVILIGFFLLFILTQQAIEVRPSAFGKAATFFQLVAVTVVLVRLYGTPLVSEGLLTALFLVTGAITVAAGLQYMYRGLAWLQRQPAAPRAAATAAAEDRQRRSA
jgi:cardiolipin synthase